MLINDETEKKIIEDIEQISKKYDVKIKDILKILSVHVNEKKTSFIIRYSDGELKTLKERSIEKGLGASRGVGTYCALCFKKAIDERLYENMDLLEISKRMYMDEIRKNRVCISIKRSGVNVKDMVEFAESRGIELAALIRYFSLNVLL